MTPIKTDAPGTLANHWPQLSFWKMGKPTLPKGEETCPEPPRQSALCSLHSQPRAGPIPLFPCNFCREATPYQFSLSLLTA